MIISQRSTAQYIVEACEEELLIHGDTHRGAGYTRTAESAQAQYSLMLEVIREQNTDLTILDFGCGLGHLLDHIKARPGFSRLRYTGLDMSEKYLEAARKRHPEADFLRVDILDKEANLPEFDYIILNGVFNYRGRIPYEEMLAYWQEVVSTAFRHCKRGVAFNTMSKIVDWERDDLFHLPFDEMALFVTQNLSRCFIIRHDYPAYEYTTFVYKSPRGGA